MAGIYSHIGRDLIIQAQDRSGRAGLDHMPILTIFLDFMPMIAKSKVQSFIRRTQCIHQSPTAHDIRLAGIDGIPYYIRTSRRCSAVNVSGNIILISRTYIGIFFSCEFRPVKHGRPFIFPLPYIEFSFESGIGIRVVMENRHLCIGTFVIPIKINQLTTRPLLQPAGIILPAPAKIAKPGQII